jgi:hypothetical protein
LPANAYLYLCCTQGICIKVWWQLEIYSEFQGVCFSITYSFHPIPGIYGIYTAWLDLPYLILILGIAMARLKGKLELEGTLDNLSFYKTQDGIIVRQKWGPDKKRMKRDPAFSAVVNHGKDFGQAAKMSSYLRGILRSFLMEVLKLDTEAAPGLRRMHLALSHPAAEKLLGGFEFNCHYPLREHLLHLPELKKQRGRLYLEGKLGSGDMKYPEGATHAGLRIAWLSCDFANKQYQLEQSEEVLLAKKTKVQPISLRTPKAITFKGNSFFILRISFYKKTIFGMEEALKGAHAAALVVPGK